MRYLSVADLARVAFPRGSRGGLLLMLEAYFDDAGSGKTDIIAWGGFLGSRIKWSRFDRKWRAFLQAPLPHKPPLRQFHLSHCRDKYGEFADYNQGERDWVRRSARDIILPAGLIGIGHAIYRADWDDVFKKGTKPPEIGPSAAAVIACIQRTIEASCAIGSSQLAIVLDQGAHSAEVHEAIMKLMSGLRDGRTSLITIASARVENFTPLQAADTLATELYWGATRLRNSPDEPQSAHLTHFLGGGLTKHPLGGAFIARKEELASTMARWEATLDPNAS